MSHVFVVVVVASTATDLDASTRRSYSYVNDDYYYYVGDDDGDNNNYDNNYDVDHADYLTTMSFKTWMLCFIGRWHWFPWGRECTFNERP